MERLAYKWESENWSQGVVYSKQLAARVRQAISGHKGISEKHMFGGVGFLLNGNMCVGVWQQSLIARLGQEQGTQALKMPQVREFDITGRPMKGWVLIDPDGIDEDAALAEWLEKSLQFVATLPPK